MEDMYLFTLEELGFIAKLLCDIHNQAVDHDDMEVVEQVRPIIFKIKQESESRFAELRNFADLVNTSLVDVERQSMRILSKPEIETPDYN